MARKIPQDLIDRILSRVSLDDVIGDYVKLRRQGNRLVGLCPFHEEKTPSFHVNPDRGFYHCFGCGASGNAPRFLMEHDGLGFREAMDQLADLAGVDLLLEDDGGAASPSRDERERYFAATAMAADIFERCLQSGDHPHANEYLASRGIDPETARLFGLGYAPSRWDTLLRAAAGEGLREEDLEAAGLVLRRKSGEGYYDRFRGRVMFPVTDLSRRILAFSGRTLDPEEKAKYINSPETKFYTKGATLFGLAQAQRAIRDSGTAILVEGNFDVVTLHAHGFRNVCAALGTALTSDQARLLHRFTERVTLLYDADHAGREAAQKAMGCLLDEDMPQIQLAELPDGADPDDLIREDGPGALTDVLARARPMLETRLDDILAPAVGSRDRGVRRLAADHVGELLRRVRNPLVHRSLLEEAARRLRVDADRFRRYIRATPSRRAPTRRDADGSSGDVSTPTSPPLSPVEEKLVETLADKPSLLGRMHREELHYVIEHEALSAFLEEAARRWTEDGGGGIAESLSLLEDDHPLRERLSAVLAAAGGQADDGEESDRAREQCYEEASAQLKRRWLDAEFERMGHAIRKAEAVGDFDATLALAEKQRDLRRDLKQLALNLDRQAGEP